jgi:hypothetical protein
MTQMIQAVSNNEPAFSPLMLSDLLLRLAENADKAGFRTTAESLLSLASEVLDQPAWVRH